MAFNFNGTSQYIELADVTTADLPNGDWAMSFKIRRSATGTDDNIYLGTGSTAFFFLYITSSNSLEVAMGDDSGNFIGLGSGATVNDTNWHHVVVMRSGTTKALYLDGSLNDSDTSTFGACTFTSTTKFGEKGTGTAWFVGDMAEAAFWSRALLADEISGLNAGFAPSFYKNSMRWYFPMIREYVEIKENITVTNHSTTVAVHPPMFYPAITLVGKTQASTQNVLPPLISGNTQLYAPTIVPGAFTIQPPVIASSETLYNPTLTLSAISIVVPLLDSSAVLYEPSLSVGSVTVTPPVIDSTTQLYAPEILNASQQNLELPFITSSETLYNPTLTVGEVAISIPIIDSVTVLYEPTMAPGALTLSPPLISSTTTFYSPTITATYSIDMPFISSSTQLYDPTFVPSTLTVTIPFISGGTSLYAPAFIFGQSLGMPVISGNTVLHVPSISFSFFFVDPSSTGFSQVDPNPDTDFTLVT